MSVEQNLSKEYLNWLLESVSIDHDGTIADVRASVTLEFNRRHKTNYKVTDVSYWNVVYDWCKALKMTDEEAKAEEYDLWYKPETLFKAEPVAGAIEFLRKLHLRGKDYIINSSRIPELRESTIEWYKIWAPFVKTDRIHTGIEGFEGLAMKINRVSLSNRRMHLEDVPSHAKAILDYTNAHVFLMSNSDELGTIDNKRLTQIKGRNGEMPDFRSINKLFFS